MRRDSGLQGQWKRINFSLWMQLLLTRKWNILKRADFEDGRFWWLNSKAHFKVVLCLAAASEFRRICLVRRGAIVIKPTWHLVRLSRTISQNPLDCVDPVRLIQPQSWRGATYKTGLTGTVYKRHHSNTQKGWKGRIFGLFQSLANGFLRCMCIKLFGRVQQVCGR